MLLEAIREGLTNVVAWYRSRTRTFAVICDLCCGYTMLYIGSGGDIHFGWPLLVPIGFVLVAGYLRWYGNRIGKGVTIPVPSKRFTEVDDDGMVSVDYDRTQELLLYIADLEDWLERRGIVR